METETHISTLLDGNAQSFYNYLKDLGGNMTTKKANQLRQVTIMDQSIKQYVIRHRNKKIEHIYPKKIDPVKNYL